MNRSTRNKNETKNHGRDTAVAQQKNRDYATMKCHKCRKTNMKRLNATYKTDERRRARNDPSVPDRTNVLLGSSIEKSIDVANVECRLCTEMVFKDARYQVQYNTLLVDTPSHEKKKKRNEGGTKKREGKWRSRGGRPRRDLSMDTRHRSALETNYYTPPLPVIEINHCRLYGTCSYGAAQVYYDGEMPQHQNS